MSGATRRPPLIDKFYQRYLQDENCAGFIKRVAEHYTLAALARLARFGSRCSRRAALMALGFLGDYSSNAVLGEALHDRDRGVRMLAENAIRDVWRRDGSEVHRRSLGVVERLNRSHQFVEAIDMADLLIDDAPWIAEVWNQRGIANFHLRRYNAAANDCQQTLELNPYHFGAAIGMAHCYLEMNDVPAALQCFRRALKLNPNLESVRAQVEFLKRSFEEH